MQRAVHSADGTLSVSTTSGQTFGPQSGRSFNHWQTYFEMGEYKQECPGVTYYFVHPFQWNAGTNMVHPSGAPGATHCTPEHPGDTFTHHTTTASTVGAAFSILGFGGNATTGYSNSAEIGFHYTVTAQLCGVNNTPPNSPGVDVAS
jgi:hypothetical protein